jgi:DNA-binding transcriptional LysR family regulator
MDRFHLMNVFVAVAEEEGFAAGARRLRMSPPAVTRAIAALEERLSVKLLNRTTRFVRTTEAGQHYLEDARRILAEVDAADESATGINAEPHGHLAVTAPVLFGRMFVTPVIVEYLELYPGTEVSALFLDRIVNLVEEGLDVGVRIGELPDSSMRARRVGSVRHVLCASPDHLKSHGMPQQPEDLQEHSLISSSAGNFAIDWRFESKRGAQSLAIKPRLAVTTNDAAIAAAVRGAGIARLLSYQVAPQLASGELQIILDEYGPAPLPVHIVHREGRYASARVRSFIELMSERLRADLTLNERGKT